MKTYVGVDNGVTGSIAIISPDEIIFKKTPTFSTQDYTKKNQKLSRIHTEKLEEILEGVPIEGSFCLIERPMVNPQRFRATVSALRALEATLVTLEAMQIPYQFIDSKEWQKELLPSGLKGAAEQKAASKDVGIRLFPMLKEQIVKHGDADSLLIAEYARRNGL